jgi:hypothetical protein
MSTPEHRLRRLVDSNDGTLRIAVGDLLEEFRLESLNAKMVEALEDLLESVGLCTTPALGHVGIADVLDLSLTPESSLPARQDPMQEWAYWAKRSESLERQQAAARSRMELAAKRCTDAGIDLGSSAPPLKSADSPLAAAAPSAGAVPTAAAGGGGFAAVGYAESGLDADLDGDVDGGLFDWLGGLFP